MGYQCREIGKEEVNERISRYEYALIHMISEQIFSRVGELPDINWTQCLEARFFSRKGEMHIFDADGEQKAVVIEDEGEGFVLEREYELARPYTRLGKYLVVQEYLGYDEDGQIMIELTRLKDIR